MKQNIPTQNYIIILVEPKYPGNIGAIARAMMNFDLTQLYLINPPPLNDECYARAKHASSILDNTQIFPTFTQATHNIDFLVATSSIDYQSDKKQLRNALTPEQFTQKITEVTGTIGLCFGREDYGLFNNEIAACDLMIKIPTSTTYPALNLSHAATILFYLLYTANSAPSKKSREIGPTEKQKLIQYFNELLDIIQYPEHKKENTHILFKRLMARAIPSTWEYHTLMGVFSRTIEKLKNQKNH